MNRRILSVLIASLSAMLLVAGIAGAQTSDSFDLSWHAMTNGSGAVASDEFLLSGSLGQSMVNVSVGSGSRMSSGYWPATMAPRHHTYLPIVLRH